MIDVYLGNPTASAVTWIKAHTELPTATPLYFEGQEDGATVALIAWNDMDSMPEEHLYCNLECSTNGMSTWSDYGGEVILLDSCAGKRVYFRAPEGLPNTNGFYDLENYIIHCFKLEKAVKAGGNILFLLESTGARTDVPEYAFYQMFGIITLNELSELINWCGTLTQAPALPATTLADYCYQYMFQSCSSLTAAPELPATTLASNCYSSMFNGCTSLTQAPMLPAMTLADSCYYGMFSGCTSLTQAPALPAETLASYCYYYMFKNCTSLASMDVSFTSWNPENATANWMTSAGSSATGTKTFTCPAALPNTTGDSNIPSGWSRVEK